MVIGLTGGLMGGIVGGAGINIVIRVIDKFSKNIGLAQMQLSGLAGGIQRNQKAILGAGAAMTGFGIIGVAVMGGMVKEAISFESAFLGHISFLNNTLLDSNSYGANQLAQAFCQFYVFAIVHRTIYQHRLLRLECFLQYRLQVVPFLYLHSNGTH